MGKRQDVNNRMFLRPSPNEETKLLQDEKQKLRKLRLQQVRQQEKRLATRARKKFKEKEKKEIDILENELKKKWEVDITEKRSLLENEYYENVAHVGEGHQAALMCDDGAPKERSLEDEIKVSERYREALKKLKEDDAEKAQILNEKTEAKNKAMEIERLRATRVAALEPPVPDIAQNLETIQKHRYKQKNIDQYSSTYYHIPQERVEKADPNMHQVDARHAAKEEEERIQNAKEESDRNFSEQMEKARLRHKHARSKLMLEKDHNKLLEELEHFERIDRQRRQEIVSKIPKHVFEPPHRRIEANEERQREIEHAFEDMYMAQTNYMGDVTVAQDALPVSPAVTDEEISVEREDRISVDTQPGNGEDNIQIGQPSERLSELPAGEGKRKFVEEAEKSRTDARPSSKDPLKRLLKKIDIQRDRWKSNEKNTAKDFAERRNTAEVIIIPDNESEFSEGTLTMTTENTRSVSAESDVANEQRRTLLHPHEEAERTRAKSKYIQMPDTTRKIEIEKQRERLQQQKLKLQLQQQQVMQEHLQLQFDALNNDMNKKADEGESREDSTIETHLDSPTLEKKDAKFPDLSSGVLSDDGKAIDVTEAVDEAGISEASEDDVHSDPSHTEESRVGANLDRHDALHSIPESVSEDDFVALPRVSSAAVFSGVSQPLPLHFVKSTTTTPGITKLVSAEIPLTRMSPSQPVSPAQYNTGLLTSHVDQPRLDVPLSERSKGQPSLHISPPHVAIPAASRPGEAIPSPQAMPTSSLANSVTKNTAPHTADPIKQPASPVVRHDNHRPFLFPSSKPPHDSTSEDIPPGVNHGRAVISDSTSPFFHIPSTISSTPFLPEGPATFQFPGNRETDTASYLHFYQQQLLEQQNRIREQQKAIQERQQQRLEQLKQFQERLRGQRHDTGLGKSGHTAGERSRKHTGQWQSLIPSTRYPPDDTSSSTDHAQSGGESLNRGISDDVQPEISPSLEQPQVEPSKIPKAEISEGLVNDTSSSLSRYPSEVISIKDNDVSLLPKPSDLGLWSDSTPHLSSSDATKSSSTTLDDSKGDKKVDNQSRPKILHEFGLSSSSLSNNNHGNASEMNSFNRSSERSSLKSGSSYDSGPLSISSLPKSVDKNISTGSSASDSNNNLLQRMESSFQHFQEMIDEAKALNEKYLDETKHSVNVAVEKRDSLENIQKKDDAKESGLDNIPRSKEYRVSRQTNDTSPGKLAKGQEITDNILSQPIACNTGDKFHELVALDQGRHKEDEGFLKDTHGSNEDNFESTEMKEFARSKESTITKEDESAIFSSPLISNQENLNVGVQSSRNEMLDKEHEPLQSYYDSFPRALSVIPEETCISGDDLSEGILEEDDHNFEMPNMAVYKEDQVVESSLLSHVAQTEDYFTDIVRHGDDEEYGETKGFVRFPSRQSFSPQDRSIYNRPTYRTPNYVPYRSHHSSTLHSSEERRQPLKFHADDTGIQQTPESQSWGNLLPGGIMTSAEASNKFGLHIDLPTTKKRSSNDHSSSSLSTNDVVLSGLSSLSLSQTDESSTSGLSLQEAFRKSRPDFFRHSEERALRAKEARYRHSPLKNKQETGDDWQDKTPEITKHKTPETSPTASKPGSEKIVGKQSDGRNRIGKEEMKDRTKRMYENLPDIRQKAVEKQREQTYGANRAKAQEFQKQTRERLRKLNAKKTGKKT